MNQKSSTIRLIYPQWQGAQINEFFPELPADAISKGYYLGAQLLNVLAPQSSQKIVEVPVSTEIGERRIEKGILDRSVIIEQSKVALDKLHENNPDRIVTLGGECSVSVVPFTYLADKYKDDVSIIWIDAHPDLNVPYDPYPAYHAMALSACLGKGDEELMRIFPAKVDASNALLVGLRAWGDTNATKERQQDFGVKSITPGQIADNSEEVMKWLDGRDTTKVLIHFDLDALDPAEIIAAVGTDPNGMKIKEVVRLINDIARKYDVVGLTIAEHMPRVAIMLKNMLNELPLLK